MDPRTGDIIGRSLNFGYLIKQDPVLAYDGANAESYIFEDPDNALIRARRFIEHLSRIAAEALQARLPGRASLANRIKALKESELISAAVYQAFERVRETGNEAVHERVGDAYVALRSVHDCFELGLWYHNLVTGQSVRRAFVPPRAPGSPVSSDDDPELVEIRTMLTAYEGRIMALELRMSDEASERAEAIAEALTCAQATLGTEMSANRNEIDKAGSRLEEGFDERLIAHGSEFAVWRETITSNVAKANAATDANYRDLDAALQQLRDRGVGKIANSPTVINVAGANSQNLVIGGIYGGLVRKMEGFAARGDDHNA